MVNFTAVFHSHAKKRYAIMNKKIGIGLVLAVVMAVAASGIQAGEDALQNAYNAYNQAVAPLQEQLASKRSELANVMNSDTPDKARIQELYQQIGALQGQIASAELDLAGKLGDSGRVNGGYGMHHGGIGSSRGYADGYYGGMGHGRMGGGHHGGWHGGW